jgi:hypothetical protein
VDNDSMAQCTEPARLPHREFDWTSRVGSAGLRWEVDSRHHDRAVRLDYNSSTSIHQIECQVDRGHEGGHAAFDSSNTMDHIEIEIESDRKARHDRLDLAQEPTTSSSGPRS